MWSVDRTVLLNQSKRLIKPIFGPYLITEEVSKGVYKIIHMKKKNHYVRTVDARHLLPYLGPKPKNYDSLVQRITNNDFKKFYNNEDITVWDVEDYVKWIELQNKDKEQNNNNISDNINNNNSSDDIDSDSIRVENGYSLDNISDDPNDSIYHITNDNNVLPMTRTIRIVRQIRPPDRYSS